jgi:hypothetical protein
VKLHRSLERGKRARRLCLARIACARAGAVDDVRNRGAEINRRVDIGGVACEREDGAAETAGCDDRVRRTTINPRDVCERAARKSAN